MIEGAGLSKAYGGQRVLDGASFRVGPGERLALVGPNGAGKTTILRMLAGEESPDEGEVRVRRGCTVGYLPQELELVSGDRLIDFVEDVADDVQCTRDEMRALEGRLGAGDSALLERYGALQARFEHLGGYHLRSRAERVLTGLGFVPGHLERPVSSLSGGWRMRAAMARILLREPDLVLLDEPTNHLDLGTLEWLESHIVGSPSAFLMVSHDVAFLNRVVQGVLAVEGGRVVRTRGDYSRYEADRALREEQARAAYDNYMRKRTETERFIERFRAKANKARQVQSRVKMLEKEQAPPRPPPRRQAPKIVFAPPPRSGRTVVAAEGVVAGYGSETVYSHLDFRVDRDEKVALVGPNGAGKSTLLKLLAGVIEPWEGRVTLGHNVTASYFAQHQLEQLDPDRGVLDEMLQVPEVVGELQARSLLGAFLFSEDDVDKRVGILSGGEKTRLVLARMLASRSNLLLLDEPTNHLDLHSCEVLKEALTSFGGTVCLITHDRDLINRVATRTVWVENGRIDSYPGGYDDFVRFRGPDGDPAESVESGSEASRGNRRDLRRRQAEERARMRREMGPLQARVTTLEGDVEQLEVRLGEVEAALADPEVHGDPDRLAVLARERSRLDERLCEITAAWEVAATELEVRQRAARQP